MKQETNESISELREDFFIWHKSKFESFLWINQRSRVPSRWLSYEAGVIGYEQSILKPINLYASRLHIKPKLINISNNIVTLQQTNHAEIFLVKSPKILATMEGSNPDKDRVMWNLDRPWIRQYYRSDQKVFDNLNICFDEVFRFYMPWIFDEDIVVQIKQPDNSPFLIKEDSIEFRKITKQTKLIDPPFVFFQFKKEGKHIIDSDYGKISRLSPMYNIVFEANDIMIEKIRRLYE